MPKKSLDEGSTLPDYVVSRAEEWHLCNIIKLFIDLNLLNREFLISSLPAIWSEAYTYELLQLEIEKMELTKEEFEIDLRECIDVLDVTNPDKIKYLSELIHKFELSKDYSNEILKRVLEQYIIDCEDIEAKNI